MGLFGNRQSATSSAPPAPSGPTIESVRVLLDEIGGFRLQVKRPEMKVLLTQIAWNGEPYLMRRSPSGSPSEAQLIRFSSGLRTTLDVVRTFAQHEQHVQYGDQETADRLAKELDAVKQYAMSLVAATGTGGFAAGFNADVNTSLLQRLTHDIH